MTRDLNVPKEAAMGCAESLHPEYLKKIKGSYMAAACDRYYCGWIDRQGLPGAAPGLTCVDDGQAGLAKPSQWGKDGRTRAIVIDITRCGRAITATATRATTARTDRTPPTRTITAQACGRATSSVPGRDVDLTRATGLSCALS